MEAFDTLIFNDSANFKEISMPIDAHEDISHSLPVEPHSLNIEQIALKSLKHENFSFDWDLSEIFQFHELAEGNIYWESGAFQFGHMVGHPASYHLEIRGNPEGGGIYLVLNKYLSETFDKTSRLYVNCSVVDTNKKIRVSYKSPCPILIGSEKPFVEYGWNEFISHSLFAEIINANDGYKLILKVDIQSGVIPPIESALKQDAPSKKAGSKTDPFRSLDTILETTELKKGLKDLWISGRQSDIKILVGEHEFKVHKPVLCANSQVFCLQLRARRTFPQFVRIKNFDADCVRSLLEFFYTDELSFLDDPISSFDLEKAASFLKLGAQYQVPHLTPKVIDKLIKALCPYNAISILVFAVVKAAGKDQIRRITSYCHSKKNDIIENHRGLGFDELRKTFPEFFAEIFGY